MAMFDKVFPALKAGHAAKLPTWEAATRMYVDKGELVCQRRDGQPYSYDLSWFEIVADNWIIIEAIPVA
jgi:hypothetical protein